MRRPATRPPGPGSHLWMEPSRARRDGRPGDTAPGRPRDRRGARAIDLDARLGALSDEVAAIVDTIPADRRILVTGHESLGYFAERYGFTLVGAIIPSVTTSAAPSAADLAALAARIRAAGVPAIFTELGTSPTVAEAIGSETGARVVELTTHAIPADGTYATFIKNIATLIADNLR